MIDAAKGEDAMQAQTQAAERQTAANADGAGACASGRLKIFFGYADGVGKTSAMLRAAHQAKARGIDTVVGYLAPHARPQTAALLRGLERLGVRQGGREASALAEFDLDAALSRRPQLVLIDALAHTNEPGSRHVKRYQDVQELLAAGIDVYTTLNVQHIESLNDTVASITGIFVRERIPDSVFDGADQVELVDIEPEELLERLPGVTRPRQAGNAAADFFTLENLSALRELALRRCADRMNLLSENARLQSRSGCRADEHILVCLSSSPSNAKIIRTAARMASAFRGSFTALYVETPADAAMSEEDKRRLRENMRLARQLGASIETGYGEDVPYQIAEFARLSGVSKIVIGRSTATRRSVFGKPALTERLIATAPNLDIHIIPDAAAESGYGARGRFRAGRMRVPPRDAGKSALVLLASTLVGFLFAALGVTEANIITVYLLGVLIISVITSNRLCGILASAVSVLIFNFFFTPPRFTFHFYDPGYLATFAVMFIAALLAGSLAARLKENARQSAQAAVRTKLLFETNQLLQKERDEQAVVRATAGQLVKLLRRDLVIYLTDGRTLLEPGIYRAPGSDGADLTAEEERSVAQWVLRNNKHAGATTDTLSDAKCLYLAIRVNQQVYGVVGISMTGEPPDSFENSVLLSILGECALALENIRNAREKEEAAILAKNEQLRANLLRAISHDLRTPLTSISGNASNLLANEEKLDKETRTQIFSDIYDDAMWLINLVENLLAVTRIEEGRMNLNRSAELMDEVVAEALRHVSRKRSEHTITATSGQELILAQIDAKLIVQVIINLVDNAIKYTPAGSKIAVHTVQRGKWVDVSVSDDGPGVPDAQKPRVFDMFYSGANTVADSRRSLGLGLSLCKSIVTAHGGTITVADNVPCGAVFTFTIPAGEVQLHE